MGGSSGYFLVFTWCQYTYGLDPGDLDASPVVVREKGQAVDGVVEGVDEEVLEIDPLLCEQNRA